MQDNEPVPDDLAAHWRRIAAPANVAVTASRGEWVPAPHLMYLSRNIVEMVTAPEQTFLNIQAAVRHGKSELITVWTVVWALGLFPGARILVVCATGDLAERFSRRARDIFTEWGPTLFGKHVRQDVRAVDEWEVSDNGSVRAVGVGGMITGMGFDLIVVDDPIKDQKEARSEATKANLVEWYSATLRTRLHPGGTLLFTMARWTEDDLSATVVEAAAKSKGDPWRIIKLPALAEAPADADLETWTDELGRSDGDPLWPAMWPKETLERIRDSLPDQSTWQALYQQNPQAKRGNMFQRDRWVVVGDEPDDIVQRVRGWDLAGSSNKGDWTVGVLLGRTASRRTVVLDVRRHKFSPSGVEELIAQTAADDGPAVQIRMELPKGDANVTRHHYSQLLAGYEFKGTPVVGNKVARAELFASAHERGLVSVLDRFWTDRYVDELASFPRGRHDDQVDASTVAFGALWDRTEVDVVAPTVAVTSGFVPDDSVVQQVQPAWGG